MRIAFISYEFPPATLGGIATYARHAVEMLVARGHDTTVFAGCGAGSPGVDTWHGARVHRLHHAERRTFSDTAVPALAAEHRRAPFDVAEAPDLYAEGRGLRQQAPDLPYILRAHTPLYIPSEIDFQSLRPAARVASAARRLLGGLRHRAGWRKTWHDARARVHFKAHFDPLRDPERQVALEADLVVPPSQRLARRLHADWGLADDHIRVLPYPHSPAADLLALHPPAAVRTVGFHGSIRYFKGVHVLVAAMGIVARHHPSVRLALAGTSGTSPVPVCTWKSWQADQMIEWQDTLTWLRPQLAALGDRVILRGFVPPGDLVRHLAEADLCVFPSLFDNFPSACLEAMSAARPIVATRSGGMEEMLGDEEGGLLVAPGRVRALADAICRLIEDPVLRVRLAQRARERVVASYAPEVIGPRHEAIYREAIARRRAA